MGAIISLARVGSLIAMGLINFLVFVLNAYDLHKTRHFGAEPNLHSALGFSMFVSIISFFGLFVLSVRHLSFGKAFTFLANPLIELGCTAFLTLLWFIAAVTVVAVRDNSIGSYTRGSFFGTLATLIGFLFIGFFVLLGITGLDLMSFMTGNKNREAGGPKPEGVGLESQHHGNAAPVYDASQQPQGSYSQQTYASQPAPQHHAPMEFPTPHVQQQ
ncbi:hypothetical protein H4219_000340 [Mycoemilia scoparia]|uniref:MARVEL domain-containing protein n=1 Tax=Mycoemilia scoparia TaxID=417184 RepID=A0A9W8A417_9FUNG|nr:hypothetical protein H4219_000340 [Mycoemilia scoparia]